MIVNIVEFQIYNTYFKGKKVNTASLLSVIKIVCHVYVLFSFLTFRDFIACLLNTLFDVLSPAAISVKAL